MAKISSYPIISIPTLNDLLIGTDVENLNETKNFSISAIGTLIGEDYVPYTGATENVNLGSFNIRSSAFIVGGGTASQFLKADGTLDSTVYTPQTRTLTINGTTYNLSANRSWDLNTIESLTTTGTSGAATYVGKVLNIPVYQAQGNYITQLSGEATGSGPGNASVTLSNAAVISKVLTGLNITGGTISDTDTILQAFGKVQNQINGLTGGVEYQGTWNAATNTPFLQSSVGVKGHYYVVNVAGSTNLNGITDWKVGDWAIYNGDSWDKVDNTDAVVSVNGYTGAVVLTASDVGAVPTARTLTINGVGYDLSVDRAWTVGDVRTDQSYTNPSWITSLGWSKITSTPTTLAGYGITDGASNATTLTINGVTFDISANRTWNVGTVTSVGTSGPLTGGTITGSGTIGITQASSTTDGYLSAVDWNTFNNKQITVSVNAPLTFAAGVIGITQSGASSNGYLSSTDWNTFNSKVSGSGTANTLPMWGSASSLVNSPLSYAADTFNFQYNSSTGGTVNFTNIGLTTYTYSIQMNNFGSPRSTIHSYTDGLIIQSIGGTQVSRMFANGNLILGTGTVDNGYKLEITGNLYVNSIVNAVTDTDRFIVSDGGVIKYRTGAQILSDIGAVSSVGLTMPAAFTVSNSPITSSGTIGVTAAGTSDQYIRGDGTLADFPTTGGGGSSVSYYLNGSVNQGTFGGNTYYEMSKTPILGAGTDFSIGSNGYIAQFITDAGDPNLLEIPGGNWNLEFYFSASSGGGTPNFYVELYKYDGTTFTLIASNSTNPELIAFGTTINPYFSSLAVSQTSLLATDRLAIRIYVNTSGRTITLHTENSHLCQIITTFTTGLTALNGLTYQVQYFQTGTSGTDFNISSLVDIHTFNLPTASATNRGALSSADWTTFNSKIGGTLATGQVAFGTAANTIGGDNGLFWDNTNKRLGIGTAIPSSELEVLSTDSVTAIRITSGLASTTTGTSTIRLQSFNSASGLVGSAEISNTAPAGGQSVLLFSTSPSANTPTERWRITSTGVFQSNGAQTIQTSSGALTLQPSNNVLIGTTTDAGQRLQVTGTTLLNGVQIFQGTTATDTAPLGPELTTTGSGTNWTGTDFATGYTHVVGSTASLTTTLAAVVGTYYQITYTVTGRTTGTFTINYGGTSTVGLTGTGNTGPVATTTSTLEIVPTSTFDGTIVLSVRTISNSSPTTVFRTSSGTNTNEIRASDSINNTFIGLNAGRRNTTGINNSFFGMNSAVNNTTGSNNTFVGRGAGFSNSIGSSNSFFGLSAGIANTTGSNNSFFGRETGLNNTTGASNSFFGVSAGASNTTGTFNTAIGASSLRINTTGTSNAAFGGESLELNTTGGSNSVFGTSAFRNNTTGSNNTIIGRNAGRFIADGTTALAIADNSVFLGFDTRANADNQTNQIVIGNQAIGLGSNTTVIGNSSTTFGRWYGNLLIGTTTDVASSMFTMSSTTQGFLPPRMTAAQRTAIASPAEGLIVYQTDSVIGLYIYSNSVWRSLTMV